MVTIEMPISTDEFRLLHTMIRVTDLDKSIDFYTRHLGMKVLRRKDYEQGRLHSPSSVTEMKKLILLWSLHIIGIKKNLMQWVTRSDT